MMKSWIPLIVVSWFGQVQGVTVLAITLPPCSGQVLGESGRYFQRRHESPAEASKNAFGGDGDNSKVKFNGTDSSDNALTTTITTNTQTSVPVTPCNRICRYNANIYQGQVCIGCFRETYEIAAWKGMSAREKYFTLIDAIDRLEQVTATTFTKNSCNHNGFQIVTGAVSREELERQAKFWKEQADL
jgi:predicted Fe-S protein YdhL (DUF1289 family)